jgi:hypothetical protein
MGQLGFNFLESLAHSSSVTASTPPFSETAPDQLPTYRPKEVLLPQINYYAEQAIRLIEQIPLSPELYSAIYGENLDAVLASDDVGVRRAGVRDFLLEHKHLVSLGESELVDPEFCESMGIIASYFNWLRDSPTYIHLGPVTLTTSDFGDAAVGGGIIQNVSIEDWDLRTRYWDIENDLSKLSPDQRSILVAIQQDRAEKIVKERARIASTHLPELFQLVDNVTQSLEAPADQAYLSLQLNRFVTQGRSEERMREVIYSMLLANTQQRAKGGYPIAMDWNEFEQMTSGIGDHADTMRKWLVGLRVDGRIDKHFGEPFPTLAAATHAILWYRISHSKNEKDLVDQLRDKFGALIADYENSDQVSRIRLRSILSKFVELTTKKPDGIAKESDLLEKKYKRLLEKLLNPALVG